jgi:hypothetical protein
MTVGALNFFVIRLFMLSCADLWARTTGMNCLALIACLMFPRCVINIYDVVWVSFRLRTYSG